MKNPKIKTKVVHSKSKKAWNLVAVSLGKKHKIAVFPYLDVTDSEKQEALQHAEFVSYCFNNADTFCKQ